MKDNKVFVKKNNYKKHKKQFTKKPKSGELEDQEIAALKTEYETINVKDITLFTDIPLSKKTLRGLKDCKYKTPTDIQKESIVPALNGRDILGAAITGSGKTLAFLIPILENLFQQKWSRVDGVGAIIISPTRELSYQIFETLKKVGAYHDFSGALIIGGKNLKFERSRMDQCNIIICTPGRLLQHMDENPLFNCDSMRILVLDEADRCLDMGFEKTMNDIFENLPKERQTLLFSATQTKSVRDLARLNLVSPVYVAPHENNVMSTPEELQQNYVVIELQDKVAMLWSFIKNHLKQKTIVFFSSCKQVKFIYEMYCKLHPGVSLLALYGTLHQDRRMTIYDDFCRKSRVVLFATDIAARGLDFPTVNWVIQMDCPEDATAYIHRAGRTARHKSSGENLLVLLPSEEDAMIEELKSRKIPINKIHIDPKRMMTPRVKMEAYLAQNSELKATAQRAFVAYIKSVYLMKNKKIFNVDKLDTDAFAISLGLAVTPRIRFLQRAKKNQDKQKKQKQNVVDAEYDENEPEDEGTEEENADEENNFKKTPHEKLTFNVDTDSDDPDEGENLFSIKRRDHEIEMELNEDDSPLEEIQKRTKPITKAALAKKVLRKNITANQRVVFDEEGNKKVDTSKTLQSEMAKEMENCESGDINGDGGGIDIEKAKKLLREEDKFDKQRFKEMNKIKRKEKLKKKSKKKSEEDEDENSDQDYFGSESDDGDLPDMSWLPDPDKIYGKKSSNDGSVADDDENFVLNKSDVDDDDDSDQSDVNEIYSADSVNEEDEGVNDEAVHKPPKKLFTKKIKRNKNMYNNPDDGDGADDDEQDVVVPPKKRQKKDIASKLTIDEAEMIAMKLINN